MITIEKDAKSEEIFIHGSPESLREFAKSLWGIAEKGEAKGKHKEHLTNKVGSEPQLASKLQGEPGKHSVIRKLTIVSRAE